MYLTELPDSLLSTTIVKIRYDCCNKEHKLKWKDADKNFINNNGKHICRPCWLKSDANPAKKKENTEKAKKTNMERYGASVAMNKPEEIEKRRQKFGDEEWLAQWNEKHKKTSQERYNVDHPMKTKEVKEKQKQSMIENWGVDYPLQSEEIREKTKQTNLDRYGFENPAQVPEIREKMYKTTEERHGVKHYNELPEMREYMRENCKGWLKESWESGWQKGIPKSEESKKKASETVSALINQGKWLGGGNKTYQGWYNAKKCLKSKIYWRSGYELITLFHLDNDENVEYYDYEPFQTHYYDTEGKKRRYTIDLIVKYKNQNKLLAIEVKNNYTNEQSLNKQKYRYFIEECEKNNINFEIWKNEKIKSLGLKLEDCLKHENVEVVKIPN